MNDYDEGFYFEEDGELFDEALETYEAAQKLSDNTEENE